MMTVDLILLILALVCFVIGAANVATVGWGTVRVNLIALGLALWVASLLL